MDTDSLPTVIIPWRATPDRMEAHERVRKFWQYFGFPVIESNSNRHASFHLCEARNKGVKATTSQAVIVADADTIPDIAAVTLALDMLEYPMVIYPHDRYRHIPGEYADKADLMTAPYAKEIRNSVGGLFITQRTTYLELGGMDERFERRWGYEDSAFVLVAQTLAKVQRCTGTVFSFDHAADRDMTENNPNRMRFQLYRMCSGNPSLMRELLKK